MEADSLAARIGVPRVAAVDLLRLHRSTYRRFWEWVDGAVDYAMLHGTLHTTLGWKIHRGSNPNPRSLRNFLMQANGAEMLRLACCYATEGGIAVCAPVHDALLIEASIERIDDAVAATKAAMAKASSVVLSGFELRSDVRVFPYPQRYADERGARMWSEVQRLLQ
jgi:DNA polymerase I-like protein with 3'-5' exonuclease and polymerase domains